MKAGDKVRLRPNSDRRTMLGPAANAIGTVTAASAGTIDVHYPEHHVFGMGLPKSHFGLVQGGQAHRTYPQLSHSLFGGR